MNEDKSKLEIPHFVELKNLGMKLADNFIRTQIALVECYLMEYCEAYGIKETELKDYLIIGTCPPENSIWVRNVDDERDVKFGVAIIVEEHNEGLMHTMKFDVYGKDLEKFPKTSKLIEDVKNGRNNCAAYEHRGQSRSVRH